MIAIIGWLVVGVFTTLVSYFLTGYLWVSWLCYKVGSGYEFPNGCDSDYDLPNEWEPHFFMWPISMVILFVHSCKEKVSIGKKMEKFTFKGIHDKGKLDNDIDYQAEKHLLGGKW